MKVNKGEDASSKIEFPTSEHVHEAMTGLISGDVVFFDLWGDRGLLTVVGSNSQRIRVVYRDVEHTLENTHQYHWGVALDPSLVNDKRKIRVNHGTETTPEPIYRTLPSEKALVIALYFLEHEAPPKGLAWDGRMDRFQ